MPPRLRGGAWGHPGNVQARGLNPAQHLIRDTQPGPVKFPAVVGYLDPENREKVSHKAPEGPFTSCAAVKFRSEPADSIQRGTIPKRNETQGREAERCLKDKICGGMRSLTLRVSTT